MAHVDFDCNSIAQPNRSRDFANFNVSEAGGDTRRAHDDDRFLLFYDRASRRYIKAGDA